MLPQEPDERPQAGRPPAPGPGEPAALRLSDSDRHEVVAHLREHCAAGRLTLDEFSERVGLVFEARTATDLAPVVTGLPPPHPAAVAGPPPVAPPGAAWTGPDVAAHPPRPARRRDVTRWTVAIMSGSSRKGRWRVGRTTTAVAIMGGVELDLREVEFETTEIEIVAVALMGSVEVIVPEGIAVDLSGMPIMGGKDLKVADVPRLPGSPLVRVKAFPCMGGVVVRSKPPRGQRPSRRARRRSHRGDRSGGDPGAPSGSRRVSGTASSSRSGPASRQESTAERFTLTRQERAELRRGAAPDGTVTMLFSDIEGSSEMADALGDQRWWEVLRTHNRIIRDHVAGHGGAEVKCQGDGFMVAFSSARRAVLCAIDIQRSMVELRSSRPDLAFRVRVGLHTGEVIRDSDDFFGKNVIVASRIAAAAEGDEILVSSLVKALVESGGDLLFGEGREAELKGFAEPYVVHPVDWSPTVESP